MKTDKNVTRQAALDFADKLEGVSSSLAVWARNLAKHDYTADEIKAKLQAAMDISAR